MSGVAVCGADGDAVTSEAVGDAARDLQIRQTADVGEKRALLVSREDVAGEMLETSWIVSPAPSGCSLPATVAR